MCQIYLVNDVGFRSDEFYHDYAIVNVADSDRIIEGLRLVFVELPKFVNKRVQNDACISSVEREQTRPEVKFKPKTIQEKKMAVLWLRFLTEIGEKTAEAPAELLENEQTRKALSIVEKSAMTEGQLYAYEKFWDAVINEEVLIEGGYNKGMAEGMEKGMAEGMEKGMAEGVEKGRAEGEANERMKNARSLKDNGVPIDVIAKSLGLTQEKVGAI